MPAKLCDCEGKPERFSPHSTSQQGDGGQAARIAYRHALVHLLLLFPKNLTPLRALRFSGAPLLRALIPLCAQIHSFRICLSAYWGQKQKASFLLLQIIVSAHENLGELSPAVFRDLGGAKTKIAISVFASYYFNNLSRKQNHAFAPAHLNNLSRKQNHAFALAHPYLRESAFAGKMKPRDFYYACA